MAVLREYDTVRVVRLNTSERFFTGTDGVMRPPSVGDVAIICHETDANDPSSSVTVEIVDEEGRTIWLAEFAREELEILGAGDGG